MLEYIKVDSLFGLYSYSLQLVSDDEEYKVKFITGPNGYGKTTLLSFVDALYSGNFDVFFKVPFSSVEFKIKDIIIRIGKPSAESVFDENFSETFGADANVLNIHVEKQGQPSEDYKLVAGEENDGIKVLLMYLKSLPCYYVKDQRLFRRVKKLQLPMPSIKDEPTVDDNAEHLRRRLENTQAVLTQNLQTMMSEFDFDEKISEKDYSVRCQKVVEMIDKLKSYGLLPNTFNVYSYDAALNIFLAAYINALEKALHRIDDFVGKLDAFCKVIRRFEFADKELIISPKFGYRFRLKNATETILSPSDLSSGEQHILIMAYEMIFKAQEDSLVLIDEPEMSFHLMWQMEFFRTLEDILNVRKRMLQFVVATHSPQIFDHRWDLTIDLFSQMNNKTGSE